VKKSKPDIRHLEGIDDDMMLDTIMIGDVENGEKMPQSRISCVTEKGEGTTGPLKLRVYVEYEDGKER
jgi:hypothetical protein